MKGLSKKITVLIAVMLIVCIATVIAVLADPTAEIMVYDLKTNSEKNPIGFDDASPYFSWKLKSEARGVMQASYRIMVSSTAEKLSEGDYDMWDSGIVPSDTSNGVTYGGKALSSSRRIYWKVEVTDENGNKGVSEEEAWYETGLMDEGWQNAEWIGRSDADVYNVSMDVVGANWLWLTGGAAASSIPAGTVYFKTSFTVDSSKTVKEAFFGYTADDYGEIYLNGMKISEMLQADPTAEKWKTGAVAYITDVLSASENEITAAITNATKGYAGFIGKIIIRYTDGSEKVIVTDDSWLAYTENAEDASTPDQVIAYGQNPWGTKVKLSTNAYAPRTENSAPMLRYAFNTEKDIASARLYATAAGIYEISINGEKVSGNIFDPGWTDYTKRILYQSFDVTDKVTNGENVISAVLGNGWYAGSIANKGKNQYGYDKALLALLKITYTDGSTTSVVTNSDWKAADNGPILSDDFQDGESYDARREIIGWENVGFDDSTYKNAGVYTAKELGIGTIEAQGYDSVVVKEILPAIAVTEPEDGVYIYDFGQNFAGVVEINITGEAGTTVKMRHGEMLNDASGTGDGAEGTLFTANLRTVLATDYYTLKGDPNGETYRPRFTYHGFRYVEITGIDEPLPLDAVKGIVIYTDLETAGSFESSNELLNKLYQNTMWGQKSNFVTIPTDCPQRNERLAWTGDAQIFAKTANYNMEAYNFYDNFMDLMRDQQRSDGAFPDNAPLFWNGYGYNGWGDAGVIVPWQVYQHYGNKQIIIENYDAMKAWIAYQKNNSTDLIRPKAAQYGDWMALEGTPITITDTAYFAYSTHLVAKMAEIIGETADAAYYYDLFEQIRDAWNAEFVYDDGTFAANTQTMYVIGIEFELFRGEARDRAAELLVEHIRSNDYHLKTGFIGTAYLTSALTKVGHADIAYRLLEQETYPSWLYAVNQGATTVWERWDAYSLESGFSGAAKTNISLNHYSYGAVCEWMYRYILGIERDEQAPGFKHIILQPTIGGTLTYAKGSYDSSYGNIEVSWSISGETLTYSVTVPANTTATLYLPTSNANTVTEGSTNASSADGITFLRYMEGKAVYELTSGSYSFKASIPSS